MMKLEKLLGIALTCILLGVSASTAAAGPNEASSTAECSVDDKQVPTCRKASSSKEEETPAQTGSKARKAKECTFTCRKTHGIWVCKGSGKECNGKSPWL